MGYRHSGEEILEAAKTVALERGFGALTFGAVGRQLGISDRTVVYYFPAKEDLIVAVARAFGAELEQLLEAAFGNQPLSPPDLVRRAWPVVTTPAADRVFALYFEIVGLAASGREPFVSLARTLVEGWVAWLTPRTLGTSPIAPQAGALLAIAQLDGLLLVRLLLGPDAAEQAAVAAGVSGASGRPG
jgi:AcrR family transcriptional regulator